MSSIAFAGLSDRGLVRASNEDSWLAEPAQNLFVVSDGMGGRNAGAVASKLVVKELPILLRAQLLDPASLQEDRAHDTLCSVLLKLSHRIHEHGRQHPELAGMGATVVAVVVRQARALVAHLGDSRLYHLRNGHLRAVTNDHSIAQYLIDLEELSEEKARRHSARGKISRYVGMENEVLPDVCCIELEKDDRLLLCTDGLTRMVPEAEITNLLIEHSKPKRACRSLVDAANAAGGDDNITVLVVDWHNS